MMFEVAELNKPVFVSNRVFNQRGNSESRKPDEINFDQLVPSNERTLAFRDSGYSLDSFSQITENQSLSAKQIAELQKKAIDEKFDALTGIYKISKPEEVKSFLSKNRFLISLLKEIPHKIFQYYGSNQKLALEVLYEPDFPLSSELWVLVLTELPAKKARSIMDKLDEDWWLENMSKTACQLNIGIEYV